MWKRNLLVLLYHSCSAAGGAGQDDRHERGGNPDDSPLQGQQWADRHDQQRACGSVSLSSEYCQFG